MNGINCSIKCSTRLTFSVEASGTQGNTKKLGGGGGRADCDSLDHPPSIRIGVRASYQKIDIERQLGAVRWKEREWDGGKLPIKKLTSGILNMRRHGPHHAVAMVSNVVDTCVRTHTEIYVYIAEECKKPMEREWEMERERVR